MGAAQSARARSGKDAGAGSSEEPEHVDYYELLQVEPTATQDEIKKRYRLLALKHHPDKNPDRVEEATKYFHKLQEAFEILSDEQERAWYDSNRERYLNGDFDDAGLDEEVFESFREGNQPAKPAGSSSAGLTPRHLMRFFDPSIAADLSDSDSSFFGTYRRLFERIAEEEIAAASYPGEDDGGPPPRSAFPSFGYSHTPFVADKTDSTVHQTPARDFYTVFLNFQSRKSMGWLDQYRVSDAPDRRVKRLMEKENKRARESGRREYNDTIRALAGFVRKRDPRYKSYQASQEKAKTGPEAEASRRAFVTRMEQERQARANAFQAQSWQVAEEVEDIWSEGDDYEGGTDASDSDADTDIDSPDAAKREANDAEASGDDDAWDCVVCDKVFRSEAALNNHEQSSKHQKAVKALQRKMRKEDKELGLKSQPSSNGAHDAQLAHDMQAVDLDEDLAEDEEIAASGLSTPIGKSKKAKKMAKKRMKAANLAAEEAAVPTSRNSKTSSRSLDTPTPDSLPAFSAKDWEPTYRPLEGPLPAGSFTCFGFGSLIWKPPPHVIASQPGFIKGYTRRFAQHSVDHRGTPDRPGRVVTLVSSEDWHQFKDADESPEGDIVWGVMYSIDPRHATEVREYLDHREKNGYSPQSVDVYGFEKDADGKEKETLVQKETLVYVGLPDNEAFVGPSPLPTLAERIFTCQGPSGRNDEYLLNLAIVTRKLSPQSVDSHLFELERRVLQLQDEAQKGEGRGAELAGLLGKPDNAQGDAEQNDEGEDAMGSGKKARRSKKKDKKAAAAVEKCNVCGEGFDSRSKLFNHVREEGHALADSSLKDQVWEAQEQNVKGKKGKRGKK